MIDLAPLVNKSVPFKFNGVQLRLELSHALFSSYEVDLGTRLLLKAVARDPVLAAARRVLDSGCGTGVIGVAVAKAFPETEVLMRDRDSLAVAFAERNRLANRLRGRPAWTDPETGIPRRPVPAPRAEPGLLADGLEGGDWDYILSNLPAKAGAPVLEAFFRRAPAMLAPGGRLAVVIVNTLAAEAAAWVAAAGLSLLSSSRGSMHTVYVAEAGGAASRADSAGEAGAAPAAESPAAESPAAESPVIDLSGLDLGPYLRCESAFKLAGLSFRAKGFWGLPDFDTLGFGTLAAAEIAGRACAGSLVREALVIHPGVGHLAMWMAKTLGCARISAAGRDILSLAATGANLASLPPSSRPACRALDALRLDELAPASFDLLAETPDIVPEYDWAGPAWLRAGRLVKTGGCYLAICPPTELGRLEKRRPAGWSLLGERRKRGFAAAAWRRS
jgi:SAM-dependent methyltransferase